MPAGHPSSSSRTAALFVLTAVLGISGCAGRTALLSETSASSQPLRLTTITDGETAAAAPPAPRIEPVAETPATKDIVPAAAERSAWCEYLAEDAAADATVLRSPTLKGQIDDDAKGSVSVSLSASSFRKATLLEQSAEARCRAYLAESGLQKVVFLAPQTLSAAGFRAKADSIQHRSGELQKLKARIDREIKAGNMPADKATSLSAMIEGLYSAAAEARSEAERRAGAAGNAGRPGGGIQRRTAESRSRPGRDQQQDAHGGCL